MSETQLCRPYLERWCRGAGLDLGCGDDRIVPWAIGIDRKQSGAAHILDDISEPARLFQPGSMDFLFSSHAAEDFADTITLLKNWFAVLKPGGLLVLYLPDQKRYVAHCKANNALPNQDHKNPDFSMEYVMLCLATLKQTNIIYAADPLPEQPGYSFGLVVAKT